jgi:hypothetical protein
VNVGSQQHPPVRISDPSFKDACEAAKLLAGTRRRPLQLVKGLRGGPRIARFIRSLPTLAVPVSDINVPIADHLRGVPGLPGMRRRRLCQAVLPLEVSQERYLAGKPRERLRTNLNRAKDLEITCVTVDTDDDKHALVEAMSKDLARFSIRTEALFRFPDDIWMEARSREGERIAMALLSHSSAYGLLDVLIARTDHPASPQARWALHSAVVQHLRSIGGEYMFVVGRNALFIQPGLQYFQHLNGYQLMNVRLAGGGNAAMRDSVQLNARRH